MPDRRFCHPRLRAGMTLIEVLAAVGICAVLCVLAGFAYPAILERAHMATELGASKTLITAYRMLANDQDGRLMPGIDKSAGTLSNPVPFAPENRTVTYMEAPHRYPFRLAPYFDYRIAGTVLINGAQKQVDGIFGAKGPMHDYGVSLCPALGINYRFCGGYVESSGQLDYPSQVEAVTRLAQADRSILVFASAGGSPSADIRIKGYFKLEPPTAIGSPWSSASWTPTSNAGDYGSVDARYDGQAVCAFLDGSIKLLTIDMLRDMRLWSRNAAEQNNPAYQGAQ